MRASILNTFAYSFLVLVRIEDCVMYIGWLAYLAKLRSGPIGSVPTVSHITTR